MHESEKGFTACLILWGDLPILLWAYAHNYQECPMARPVKQRYIGSLPQVTQFKPRGIPVFELEILTLSCDEFEAIRLADLSDDAQEEAAAKMNVSRQTFGRILERAHRIIADAIVNGKAINIGGGVAVPAKRQRVHCRHCRRAWQVPSGAMNEFTCPRCRR